MRLASERHIHDFRRIALLLAALPLLLLPHDAAAHGAERGLIMLLPTDYYLTGGAIAVTASFAVLLLIPAGWFSRAARAVAIFAGVPLPPTVVTSTASFLFLILLVATGLLSTADPLANPLPLFVWTFFWVALTLIQALFGNLWPWLNPWTGLLALLRKITGLPLGRERILALPIALGYLPAIVIFFLFAWYELVSLAPEDPPGLAVVVSVYWAFTLITMILFGEDEWTRRGEPFSVYFRMIGMLAPVSATPPDEGGKGATMRLSWPGQRCLETEPPPLSASIFLLLTLGTVSFDGLSRTFTWLSVIGINPLEFPGRSAVIIENSFGLIAAPAALAVIYFTAVLAGAKLAGAQDIKTRTTLAAHLVYSIVPISIAFHGAHYLTVLLMNGQYLYVIVSDPFALGWNLFGTADWHVTGSFFTNLDNVRVLWTTQTVIIVTGHCIGILLAHMIALRHFGRPHRATLSQVFLALAMVFYTVFGLWLLSTPTAG
jgi:hypothetical protein